MERTLEKKRKVNESGRGQVNDTPPEKKRRRESGGDSRIMASPSKELRSVPSSAAGDPKQRKSKIRSQCKSGNTCIKSDQVRRT